MDGFQERKWFVYQTDHHEGPFSLSEIQQKLTSGEVQRTHYVWCEGMSDWQIMTAVRDFEALTAPIESSSPAPAPLSEGSPEVSSFIDGSFSKDSLDFELNPPVPDAAPQGAPISLDIPVSSESSEEAPAAATPEEINPEPAVELSPADESRPGELLEKPSEPEPEMPALSSVWKDPAPRSFGFLRVFLTLSVVGLGAYGYKAGHLDPVVRHPGFVKFLTATRGAIQPGLSKLAQWVPALQSVFSPIADLEGVLPEEMADLRRALENKASQSAGIALDRSELLAPSFYVVANLPDGVSLDLTLVGVPDSLLSQTSLTATAHASIDQWVARFDSIRQADGRPMVQGQYLVVVTESEAARQTPEAAAALAVLPDSKLLPPAQSGITGVKKVVATRSYFLGGPQDDTYAQRLKEFHDRLMTKSTDELREIRQLLMTLESQLKDTVREFSRLKSTKNAKLAARNWAAFHDRWRRMQTQLEEAFGKWNDALMKGEYFHSMLYETTRSSGDLVSQLHAAQQSGASQADVAPKQTAAEEQLARLRSQLDESEKLKPTENGMPLRLTPDGAPSTAETVDSEAAQQ
jgi:hypothetical protein